MTIRSAIEAEVPFLRTAAESLMADTFTAYSPSATYANDANGMRVRTMTARGTTPGKIASPSSQARDTNAPMVKIGDVERPVVQGGLHLPVSATAPTAGQQGTGWEYVLTTLGPLTDPALLNTRWLVVDVPAKSYATARRLDVVRLS